MITISPLCIATFVDEIANLNMTVDTWLRCSTVVHYSSELYRTGLMGHMMRPHASYTWVAIMPVGRYTWLW